MLNKLRSRFILVALLIFGLVITLIITGINIINRYKSIADQDEVIDRIFEYDQIPEDDKLEMPIYEMEWAGGPETEFTTRFFVVHCDREGLVNIFGNEYILSIDEDAADEYTRQVLMANKTRGNYLDYRYKVFDQDDELVIVFLNVAETDRFSMTILWISILTGVVSLMIVGLLLLIFSKRAMKPYEDNIARQKRFITDAGHELKTPVASIATSADILAMDHGDSEWIVNIQKQTQRLTKLINSMVLLSRMDEEAPVKQTEEFDLSRTAEETIEPMLSLAREKGKNCSCNIEDGINFKGDKNLIQQLLNILLDNAVKYSSEKGDISVDIRKNHGRVQIEIANSCDIDSLGDLERLFDRFYRPDASRAASTGGSGIGLAIAKGIVQAHKGEISVEAMSDEKIKFEVLIPHHL